MNKEEALEKFGLTNKEVKVYLALLELGMATAYEISKKTKILRQTIYDILTSLIEIGLVSHVVKAGVKYFEAADPSKLKAILKEKENAIEQALPELGKLKEITKIKPKIELYEGVEGLRTIYNDIIKTAPKELFEYGNTKNFLEILKLYFIENYIKRRVDAKIRLKLLVEKDKETENISKTNKKILRETKALEIMRDIKTVNYIYSNKFAILTLVKEPIGIVIENKEIADAQRKIFETLWKIAEPYWWFSYQ